MKIYVVVKNDKLGFYLDSNSVNIPVEAFEISEEQWFECMQFPSKYIVENNTLKIAPNWIEPVLVEVLPIVDKKAVLVSSLQVATTILQLKSALITYFKDIST